MLASPLFQDYVDEFKREERIKTMIEFLQARFEAVTPTISAGLEQIKEEEKLSRLTKQAAVCRDLQDFEDKLRMELPAPPPASTRGKRRPRKPST